VIPEEDWPLLAQAGVARIFTMGTDTRDIARYLDDWWRARLAHPESPAAATPAPSPS
jgi:methylmalonyl-CoA mutase C-terminal domain/subunit